MTDRRETRARASSPGGWGEVGSDRYGRYPLAAPSTSRRRCWRCREAGHSQRATHVGMANGVALTTGCEFHVAQWVRDGSAPSPST